MGVHTNSTITSLRIALKSLRWRELLPDVLLIGVLVTSVSVCLVVGFSHISPYILHYSTWDYWFESDPPAAVAQMLDRWSHNHYRTSHHPLISIVLFAPVKVLRRVFLLSQENAIRMVLAGFAAIWVTTVFICLRALQLRRADSVVFTILAATSASVVFWFPVPESFGVGACSIALAIMVTALSERTRMVPEWTYLLVSIATLSFTSTNWMVGLAMLFVLLRWRRAVAFAAVSFCFVMGVWRISKVVFFAAVSPLHLGTAAETIYLFNEEAQGTVAKLYAFFFHSVVMPQIGDAYGFRLSIQGMLPGSGSYIAVAGVSIWLVLLMLGGWSAFHIFPKRPKVTSVLLLAIAGQLGLAIVFGVETFMYSAHFGPLLVLLCALSGLTRARRFAVLLGAILVLLTGVNNFQKFGAAAHSLRERYENERMFTAKVAELTPPDQLIICGREAAAATGEARLPRPDPRLAAASEITLVDEPDTCSFMFEDLQVHRRGWIILYEDWSIEVVEALRKKGARYFITPYAYGLQHNTGLFEALDQRYRRMEHTSSWAFYDLAGN